MKIRILTIFPEFFDSFLSTSIVKRAISRGVVSFEIVNIRDYSHDRNRRIDDRPIGGGAGLVMRIEPLVEALRASSTEGTHKILLSPRGRKYTQKDCRRLSKMDDILLLCGHYEGVDARISSYIDEEISIGDYVLTGGEIGAMAIADSVVRLLKGAISDESTDVESFDDDLLEYDQYTYPREFEGKRIPDILFCGDHEIVDSYRRKERIRYTYERRRDLFDNIVYNKEDYEYIEKMKKGDDTLSSKELEAIEKGKRFIVDE